VRLVTAEAVVILLSYTTVFTELDTEVSIAVLVGTETWRYGLDNLFASTDAVVSQPWCRAYNQHPHHQGHHRQQLHHALHFGSTSYIAFLYLRHRLHDLFRLLILDSLTGVVCAHVRESAGVPVSSSLSLLLLWFPAGLARTNQAGAQGDDIAHAGHVRAASKDGPNGPCGVRGGSGWGRTLVRAVRRLGSSTLRFGGTVDGTKCREEHAPETLLRKPGKCL
jgi:hypothetical protein